MYDAFRRDHAYADNHIYKYEIGMDVFSAIAYRKKERKNDVKRLRVVLVYNTFMLSCFFAVCFFHPKISEGLRLRVREEGKSFIRFLMYNKQHNFNSSHRFMNPSQTSLSFPSHIIQPFSLLFRFSLNGKFQTILEEGT